jgi:hypothetical protein
MTRFSGNRTNGALAMLPLTVPENTGLLVVSRANLRCTGANLFVPESFAIRASLYAVFGSPRALVRFEIDQTSSGENKFNDLPDATGSDVLSVGRSTLGTSSFKKMISRYVVEMIIITYFAPTTSILWAAHAQ